MDGSRGLRALSLTLVLVAGAEKTAAQEVPELVLSGGRLILDPGKPAVEGTLIIKNGRIAAVGAQVAIPEGATQLDVSGRVLAPVFLDAGNGGLFDAASWSAGPTGAGDRAADMLGACDPRARWRLIRAGVGAVYTELPPRTGGKGATGSLATADPATPAPELLDGMAGVTFALGGRARNETSLLSRKAARTNVTAALDGAKRYRESWKKHEKEKEEFEKKVKEWEEKQKGGGDKKTEEKKPEEKKAEEAKEPAGTPATPPAGGNFRERMRKAAEARRAARGEEKKDSAPATSAEERPKPPLPPLTEPAHEAVLRILDRKVPIRIEAHWKEDILAACDLAISRNLRLTLLGATEALEVLEKVKEADATVVLQPPIVLGADPLERFNHRNDLAAALDGAGIPVAFMTAGAGGWRFDAVPLAAKLAVSFGLPEASALRALTTGAARALGVENDFGTLAPGRRAAVQVLSGPPLEPGTVVEKMILGSKIHDPREEER